MIATATLKTALLAAVQGVVADHLELEGVEDLPPGAVSYGRRAQDVRAVAEVHVRPGLQRNEAKGGGHQVQAHEYDLLVRSKAVTDSAKTGGDQIDALRPLAESLLDLFSGAHASGPSTLLAVPGVIGVSSSMQEADSDPEVGGALETVVRAVVFTNGTVLPEEEEEP